MSPEADVLVEQSDAITRVTFNRPHGLIALTVATVERAADAIEISAADDHTRAVCSPVRARCSAPVPTCPQTPTPP